MAKVLIVGESWISNTTEFKGFDQFSFTQLFIGCEKLIQALEANHHTVTHLRAHDVPADFPWSEEEFDKYDVVILSDIGSNSILLPTTVFNDGKASVNRLDVLANWVRQGGGLLMAGGYLSFAGFEGKAKYYNTPVESVLPVKIEPHDDRIEVPQGVHPKSSGEHVIVSGLEDEWPVLLGYQDLTPKASAQVLATVGDHPLLVIDNCEKGRTIAFASDVGPHWAPEEFLAWDGYGKLFSRMISWLAKEI